MNIGINIGIGSRRTSSASFLSQLAANSATLAVYDWTSPQTMTAGAGGPVSNGSTVSVVPNLKTPGTLDMSQASGGFRPTWTDGPVFDGTDDFLPVLFAANAGPANATLVYALRTSDTQFMLGGTNSASFFSGAAESGNGVAAQSGIAPTYHANGTPLGTTRAALFTGWGTNSPVVARITGADFQDPAITYISNSYFNSGFFFTGKCCLIAILDGSDPNHAAALALAEAEASRIITALSI